MKKATISTIPKTGSKLVLKNERGIFVLSSVRTILMQLVYKQNYETINYHMSDSNVGGRNHMSCINHIFVFNGIIQKRKTLSQSKSMTTNRCLTLWTLMKLCLICLILGFKMIHWPCYMMQIKLDGVGPVDNRPSTDKLHHFV